MKSPSAPVLLAVVFLTIIGSPGNHTFSLAVLALASSSSSSVSSSLPPPFSKEISPLSPATSSVPGAAVINTDGAAFQQHQIRASSYGIANNSTILSPIDAAAAVGVRPTLENATKGTWQRAWKLHRFLMKFVLHRFDSCRPGDSKLSLACLWWKALSGNDITSPVYDRGLSYDLLPPITRWIVSPRLCRWYPRLHHANVEIRTAYLDKAVFDIIDSTIHRDEAQMIDDGSTRKLFRLIIMGGGYDTRGLKLLERALLHSRMADDCTRSLHKKLLLLDERHREQQQRQRGSNRRRWWKNISNRRRRNKCVQEVERDDLLRVENARYDIKCYELDLLEVVQAKRRLLQNRLFRRRPWLQDAENLGGEDKYPKLVGANFNNLDETRNALEKILRTPCISTNDAKDGGFDAITTVFVFEGVNIYLDDGIPHALLQLCSEVLVVANLTSLIPSEGYLCFADRLENIPGGDSDAACVEMESTGWELIDWLPKPGLARHMGIARLKKD